MISDWNRVGEIYPDMTPFCQIFVFRVGEETGQALQVLDSHESALASRGFRSFRASTIILAEAVK